jgi:methionine synthase I (cobalamin-dependent)
MPDILTKLSETTILIADGATGTMLQRAGLPVGAAPERWNLENPDAVRNHYKAYIEAGSDIILTNTFGGSSIRLQRDGLADKSIEINQRAAELARQVAGKQVIVFGDIGPLGELLEPLGRIKESQAIQAFADQAGALARGGADAILVETMSDLAEAKAAFNGVRQVTDLPVIISFSFDTHGRTMMGVSPTQVVKEYWPLGVAAVGANCGRTLSETLAAVREMREVEPEAVLLAKPNAGLPRSDRTQSVYDVTPDEMSRYALKFANEGVKIFGGCCGSTPEHIRAVADVLSK